MQWATDTAGSAWVGEAITTFAEDVTSLVPAGYEAYVRVFHPTNRVADRRWSTMAAANGRIAHSGMQWPWIAHPVGAVFDPWDEEIGDPQNGDLPCADAHLLARLLETETSTPQDVWFGVSDIFGTFSPGAAARLTSDGRDGQRPDVLPAGVEEQRLRLPNRGHYLAHGALDDLLDVYELFGAGWSLQSPSVWWPADRAWFVATEYDFESTLAGGSATLVETILEEKRLEALPIRPTDRMTWDDDLLNRALG